MSAYTVRQKMLKPEVTTRLDVYPQKFVLGVTIKETHDGGTYNDPSELLLAKPRRKGSA